MIPKELREAVTQVLQHYVRESATGTLPEGVNFKSVLAEFEQLPDEKLKQIVEAAKLRSQARLQQIEGASEQETVQTETEA